MKKYQLSINENITYIVEVEAKDKEAALEMFWAGQVEYTRADIKDSSTDEVFVDEVIDDTDHICSFNACKNKACAISGYDICKKHYLQGINK